MSKLRIKNPAGLILKVDNENFYSINFHLYNSEDYCVGYLELERVSKDRYETHSYLDPEYQGLGIGAYLYSKAIQFCHKKGYRVSSSNFPSKSAKRIWVGNTLKKRFKIVKRKYKYKRVKWFAYPKK